MVLCVSLSDLLVRSAPLCIISDGHQYLNSWWQEGYVAWNLVFNSDRVKHMSSSTPFIPSGEGCSQAAPRSYLLHVACGFANISVPSAWAPSHCSTAIPPLDGKGELSSDISWI